jgi:hypothetical protein
MHACFHSPVFLGHMTFRINILFAPDPPPLLPGSVAPPPPSPQKPRSVQQPLALLLNLCLWLFLADALVSLLDDSLVALFNTHPFTAIRGIIGFLALLIALVVYVLMAVTPMIPKRLFLPVTLFNPVAMILLAPCWIYFYGHIQQIAWLISLFQVLFCAGLLHYMQGGFRLRWLLVPELLLNSRRFSWANLLGFLTLNLFVAFPAMLAYLALCAVLAVHHFSEGFVALRPIGFTVQVRKYVRNDGKSILLVPMSHIGEPEFYRSLSQSFPTNSTILMEGVTDDKNLLTNRITYKRVANSLGLSQQEKEFKPSPVQMVRADIDVDQFTPNTIGFLNLVMLLHAQGLNLENVLRLMQYPEPPGFEQQLFADLLGKRNAHLLLEIHNWLPESDSLVVPWGAAHMPGIAREIQKSGFHVDSTREFVAIRFGSHRGNARSAETAGHSD